jgi:hypothetical protein
MNDAVLEVTSCRLEEIMLILSCNFKTLGFVKPGDVVVDLYDILVLFSHTIVFTLTSGMLESVTLPSPLLRVVLHTCTRAN